MKMICVLIALSGICFFVMSVNFLFMKEWLVATQYYGASWVACLSLRYLDEKFHPRGVPVRS